MHADHSESKAIVRAPNLLASPDQVLAKVAADESGPAGD
jgi:hypothetical protein